MEDQQPATGDLTEESAVGAAAETSPADSEPAEASGSSIENGDETTEADETSETDVACDAEVADCDVPNDEVETAVVRFREARPATKWTTIAAAAAAALFVGAGAFAGAMMQPFLTDRAIVATKLNVARTAANAITTLWTYTPEDIDKLAERASQFLSGDFQAAYRKYLDALSAPNKQAKISNTTEVVGAAVESLSASEATAIVYTNTASTSPATKDVPSLKYLSYRLVLRRDHDRWLVTKMTTITSLDLTPKL